MFSAVTVLMVVLVVVAGDRPARLLRGAAATVLATSVVIAIAWALGLVPPAWQTVRDLGVAAPLWLGGLIALGMLATVKGPPGLLELWERRGLPS